MACMNFSNTPSEMSELFELLHAKKSPPHICSVASSSLVIVYMFLSTIIAGSPQ